MKEMVERNKFEIIYFYAETFSFIPQTVWCLTIVTFWVAQHNSEKCAAARLLLVGFFNLSQFIWVDYVILSVLFVVVTRDVTSVDCGQVSVLLICQLLGVEVPQQEMVVYLSAILAQ